jgi:hypothetical protein
MAELMGIRNRSFERDHGAIMIQIKRHLFDYVRSLQTSLNAASGNSVDDIQDSDGASFTVNEEGFPVIPDSWGKTKVLKKDTESLLRNYLGTHYGKDNHIHRPS